MIWKKLSSWLQSDKPDDGGDSPKNHSAAQVKPVDSKSVPVKKVQKKEISKNNHGKSAGTQASANKNIKAKSSNTQEKKSDNKKKPPEDNKKGFASRFQQKDDAPSAGNFAGKFNKGEGFRGSASGGGKSFAKRFRPEVSEVSSDDTSDDNTTVATTKKIMKRSESRSDMSYAEKTRRNRSQNIFVVRGKDRGRAAWHYVLVDNHKREMFLAATRSGSLDVADYGEVLESGWGEDPPEHVVNKIKEEYNL